MDIAIETVFPCKKLQKMCAEERDVLFEAYEGSLNSVLEDGWMKLTDILELSASQQDFEFNESLT